MNKIYDVIIIGAGASSMATALYTARAGLSTLILEDKIYGGQMQNTGEIENYLGLKSTTGEELSDEMFEQIDCQENISYKGFIKVTGLQKDEGTKLFTVTTKKGEKLSSKSVVIATGVRHRKLGVEGESIFQNHGVSNCGYCDGNFFQGEHIAVIGGGNSAVEEALYLSDIVDRVTLIHRQGQLRSEQVLQDRLFKKDNIEVLWHTEVKSIYGNKGVEGLSLIKDKKQFKLDVKGVFIYVGVEPTTEPFKHTGFFLLDEFGYVRNNPQTMETQLKGLFAVGDVRADSVRQIASAVGDGAIAGINIKKYIETI